MVFYKDTLIAKVSSKRQITLTREQCEILGIHPGEEVEVFSAVDQLTIVQKEHGTTEGALKHLEGNPEFSEAESRDSATG